MGDQLIAVENTPDVHNVVVCTLCSCYPWDVLGLPPIWCKSDARGRTGVVERLHEANVFPGSIVGGKGEDPQWLYTIRFDGRELWGDDVEPGTTVPIDAFEPYLETAR